MSASSTPSLSTTSRWCDLGAERLLVVGDGGLEVADGDGDVVDLGQQHDGHQSSPRAWRWNRVILSSPMRSRFSGSVTPRPCGRREAAHGELALGLVVVDAQRRLAGLVEVVGSSDMTGWMRPWSMSRFMSHASW